MIQIPITNQPNQLFRTAIPLPTRNVLLDFLVSWNRVAGYWQLSVKDVNTDRLLINALPLLVSRAPIQNLLNQFQYLAIGSAYIVPLSEGGNDSPGLTDWESNFALLWGP